MLIKKIKRRCRRRRREQTRARHPVHERTGPIT